MMMIRITNSLTSTCIGTVSRNLTRICISHLTRQQQQQKIEKMKSKLIDFEVSYTCCNRRRPSRAQLRPHNRSYPRIKIEIQSQNPMQSSIDDRMKYHVSRE